MKRVSKEAKWIAWYALGILATSALTSLARAETERFNPRLIDENSSSIESEDRDNSVRVREFRNERDELCRTEETEGWLNGKRIRREVTECQVPESPQNDEPNLSNSNSNCFFSRNRLGCEG